MITRKSIPQRSCVVCREKRDKRALTRIVMTDNGIQLDPTGKMHGRGAYLCEQAKCWDRAARSAVLDKALRAELSDEDRSRLLEAKPQPVKS
jgi:predicted RNA-binding protein YlxR (DUF448 family)